MNDFCTCDIDHIYRQNSYMYYITMSFFSAKGQYYLRDYKIRECYVNV